MGATESTFGVCCRNGQEDTRVGGRWPKSKSVFDYEGIITAVPASDSAWERDIVVTQTECGSEPSGRSASAGGSSVTGSSSSLVSSQDNPHRTVFSARSPFKLSESTWEVLVDAVHLAIKFCGDCKTGTIKTKWAAWKCGGCGSRNFLDESEVGRPALAQKPPALSSSHGSPAVRLRWVEDEA